MILKFLSVLLLISMVLSCNTQSIRRARMNKKVTTQVQNTQVDSFLYYQPVALKDNFLDSLKAPFDKQVSLKVRVIPPPPPPAPKVRQVEGFRVQVFAGLDSLNGLQLVAEVKGFVQDSIYFFKENGLYKIQVGDFLYRNDADTKVYDLRKNNISSGWVVQGMINIPVETGKAEGSLLEPAKPGKEKPFTIQILATSDLQKAKAIVEQLKTQFTMEASYSQAGSLYKVFLGSFETREETQKTLLQVRNSGFKDAWLVTK